MPDGSCRTRPTLRAAQEIAVVTLPAEIDVTNAGQVYEILSQGLSEIPAVLLADASATTFCDCAGVRALTRAHRQAAAAGSQFRVAVSPAVRRILDLTRSSHLLVADAPMDPASMARPAD